MKAQNHPGGTLRNGGRILVDALRGHGVTHLFGVPGESYLAVLDALHDTPEIRFINARQEGGAAMMADAWGKMTGEPGVAIVTRGPGATNAASGVHVAFQDSTPMILLIGQVGRAMVEREAFQEIDYRRMFGQMAKWVAQIDAAERIPEFLNRAFHTATSSRPGPVVLALPEDMLTESAEAVDLGRYSRLQAHPGPGDMAALRAMMVKAERPLAIVGGGGWSADASEALRRFAEANGLPVAVSFRCQDYFDNAHPNYAGHVGIGIDPGLAAYVKNSDLVIVIGARLGEMTSSGYSLFDIPRPRQRLVHVYPDASEINRVYDADLGIVASSPAFLDAAAAMDSVDGGADADHVAALHDGYQSFSTSGPQPGAVNMGEIVAFLDAQLGPEAIYCNGAGNYTIWLHRYRRYRRYRTCLAPTSGSMGYGPPAAVAGALANPGTPVVCFAGDGCFMMTCQELTTAVQYGLPILYVVVNNGMYGTIRMHQEREYPARESGTALVNPDFAAFARACGAHGEIVERTEDFAPAFERARATGGPALIEVRIDPEALTPAATLSGTREAALSR
ncbi:MAG: thiamine pyrophosphate-binding protein [Alphaproteobacteria bacterium]|nr:thiamine pyrophosphate-binding protein [Alphaproteobacteria bacterium]